MRFKVHNNDAAEKRAKKTNFAWFENELVKIPLFRVFEI
jgi:hypothetical protein